MNTQTIERQELHQVIDELPDAAIEKMALFAAFLRYEETQEERVPNAMTRAAMEEVKNDEGEAITFEQFKTEIDALD